jgi:predicted metal-dependent HD superfamily phosphohydrolase
LDADMSVLGKEPKAYDAYASMIRREYIHVPHQVYCEKRSDILQSFLGDLEDETKSKSIYLSNDMRSALETQAISNLRREISSLRSGIIPNS